jgi:hypothetical protein
MITKRLQPAFSKLKGANQKRLTPFHYWIFLMPRRRIELRTRGFSDQKGQFVKPQWNQLTAQNHNIFFWFLCWEMLGYFRKKLIRQAQNRYNFRREVWKGSQTKNQNQNKGPGASRNLEVARRSVSIPYWELRGFFHEWIVPWYKSNLPSWD